VIEGILKYLRFPDGFRADPSGFALNQIGHALLIGLLPALLGVPLWLTAIAFTAWEYWQWRRYRAEAWDCFEDLAFVLGGAALIYSWWGAVPLVLFLISGAIRRYEEKGSD
jgi:hypothetical protein